MLCQNPPSKDSLTKMPLAKLRFFAYVIPREWSTNCQKQVQNDAFQVKTGQSPKISLILQKKKKKIGPKGIYTFFEWKPSIMCLLMIRLVNWSTDWLNEPFSPFRNCRCMSKTLDFLLQNTKQFWVRRAIFGGVFDIKTNYYSVFHIFTVL